MKAKIEQAIKKLQAGDPSGIESALESLTTSVFAFARKVCGNAQDAEDIAQETMLKFTRSVDRFSDPTGLAVWLYKVAKTCCLMSRRRSKFAPRESLSLEELMANPTEATRGSNDKWPRNPEDLVLQEELRDQLERAVQSLPERFRLVLILRDMEGLHTKEVAHIMGISELTARMRLHRARVYVRNTLDRYLHSMASSEVKSDNRPAMQTGIRTALRVSRRRAQCERLS
jgi:RNA polymerase sigma-70 factor (ECF subfamily)